VESYPEEPLRVLSVLLRRLCLPNLNCDFIVFVTKDLMFSKDRCHLSCCTMYPPMFFVEAIPVVQNAASILLEASETD